MLLILSDLFSLACWSVFVKGGFPRSVGIGRPHTFRILTMATVFGRKAEIEQIDRFLTGVAGGLSALVVAGEPGIGKTTLWQAGVSRAGSLGCRVMLARPAQSEASFAFAGLTDLLEPAAEFLGSLPPPERRALQVALLSEDGDSGHPVDYRTISVAALSLIRLLAADGPIVLAIDDVQWLDAPTAQVLQFVTRRLGTAPVGILLSVRTGEGAEPESFAKQVPEDRLVVLRLGPMIPPDVEAMLAERLGLELTRPTVELVHDVCGGNPFFALEIGRAMAGRVEHYIAGAPLPLSNDLRELVRERLARLSPAGSAALAAVAAASQPTPELIRAVLGDRAKAGLDDAQAAGTVELDRGRVRPAHPLIGATAYLELSEEDRRSLHGRLARAVEEPEERARHLALAARGPDETVARALEEATHSAARRGAPGAAAELAEQACRLTDPANSTAAYRRAALAGYHHLRSANLPRAKEVLRQVVSDAGPGAIRANAMRLLGEVVYLLGQTTEAISLFRQALEEAQDDHRVAAHIEMNLSMASFLQTDYPASQAHSHAGLRHAEQCGDVSLIAHAQGVVVFNDCLVGKGVNEQLLETALDLEDYDAPTMIWMGPTFVAPMVWMWSGRIAEARAGFSKLMNVLVERGQEATICLLGLYVTRMTCWAGDLQSARSYAAAGRTASEHSGWPTGKAFASAAEAMVGCLAGDADAARRKVEEATGILGTQSKFRTLSLMSSLGALELSLGDYAETDRILGPFTDFITTSGVREPAVAAFVADEAEALIGLGRTEEAACLVDWLAETGELLDRSWALAAAARCRALALACEGRVAEALDQVQQALLNHERFEMPVEHARTLLVKGRLHRRSRQKSAAKQAFEEALAIFELAGASAWAATALAELSRVGLRPRATGALSPTEERVAELAAQGLSTKQISAEAFMSPKSVEGVLTRVYRKLDVRSRAQLAAKLSPGRVGSGVATESAVVDP